MKWKRPIMAMAAAAIKFAARAGSSINMRNQARNVLLLSIDRMHAVDYLNCAKGVATNPRRRHKLNFCEYRLTRSSDDGAGTWRSPDLLPPSQQCR